MRKLRVFFGQTLAKRTSYECQLLPICFGMVTALAISNELGRNREKIEATHAKVKGVNEMARRGGNIVSRMAARNKRQRMALSIAAGFIVIAIVLLIYFGIFNKK